MQKSWTHLLAFVVGIALTVGLYESRRLFRNTAWVLTVASGQISGEPAEPMMRQALIERVEENPEAARRLAAALEARADGQPEQPRKPAQKVLQRAAAAGLTKEDLKAMWERRQARRKAKRAGGLRPDSSRGVDGDLGPVAPAGATIDTAIPLPAE
jgi:hypothetical protein